MLNTNHDRRGRRRTGLLAAISGAALLAAGCASTPSPTAQIESAQQAIDDAERAEAAKHASPELSQARSKLAAANTAVQNEEMEQAARLAEEARVDAELASARTAAVKAQAANEEIRRSNRALLEEMDRATKGGTQ
jgi:outer membrane PBP1 activator LpoA protein